MQFHFSKEQTSGTTIIKHLLYWIVFVFFFTMVWGTYDHDYTKSLLIQIFSLPSKFFLVYGTLLIIIPFFFLKKKYFVSIVLYLTLLIIATVFIQRPIMLFYVEPIYLKDWQSSGMFAITEIVNTALDINISAVIPVVYTLFTFWQKASQKTQALEQQQSELLKQTEKEFIYLKVEKSLQKISLKKIIYIESLKNYIKVKTEEKEIIVYKSLSSLEESLPKNRFIRVHRSFIVNTDYIDSFSPSKLNVKDFIIPIGRKYKNDVKETLGYF